MKPKEPTPAEVRKLIATLHPRECGRDLLRLGDEGDGGYLIPNDLDGIQQCFSAGVGDLMGFEKALYDAGIFSYLIDRSIPALPDPNSQLIFDRMYLGAINSTDQWTIQHWVSKYLADSANDAILKLDIEGSEFEALLSTPSILLEKFRICIVEFHSLDRMFDSFGWPIIKTCFQKLNQIFQVVHLHPNNCCPVHMRGKVEIPELMEFTFYNRRRLAKHTAFIKTFPHPLDRDNIPDKPSIILPQCWYNSQTD